MANSYDDSLRDYGHKVHVPNGFKCQYCGADGTKSFDTWLTLTVDHLLPKGHEHRNNPKFIVTACQFCNVADNRYFDRIRAEKGDSFFDNSPEVLFAERLEAVRQTRQKYKEFWIKNIAPHTR